MTVWTDGEPGVLTTGPLTTTAAPAAMAHVERARLARRARAARIAAGADPAGDAARVLAYVYACTPVTLMRPGALAEHCGISDARGQVGAGRVGEQRAPGRGRDDDTGVCRWSSARRAGGGLTHGEDRANGRRIALQGPA
jgi:hypothetical protein